MRSRPSDFDASPVQRVLTASIADGAFPGCVAAVGTASEVIWRHASGKLGGGDSAPTRLDTLYDLASLTKIISTTATAMRLVDSGRLAIDDRVSKHIDSFRGGDRDRVTIEHLLTHSSGLPSWLPLYKNIAPGDPAGNRERIVDAIVSTPLTAPPGEKTAYSDLGAILLGECLARAAGEPLATLAWKLVFDPLAMRETLYRPPRSERWRIAPTELDTTYRKRLVHGEVHDENAWAMGGVSGNAGLFSTALDLARFAIEILRARRGEGRLFERATAREFTTRRGLVPRSTRALGWDTKSERGSSAGTRFSATSFGHTGFTGTSLWIDPEGEIFAVLLTNRVHPTRANRKILGIRPRFHDAVMEAITK